jgi:hypothetical protein
MSEGKKCTYHPDRDAIGFCQCCKRFFCLECLVEGPEYYYCKAPACMKLHSQALEQARDEGSKDRRALAKVSLTEEEKTWIEESFLWLIDQFGSDILRLASVVLPTEEFFPDRYDSSDEAVDSLVSRVCAYMKVDPNRLELIFYEASDPIQNLVPIYESSRQGAAGLFSAPDNKDKLILGLELSHLGNPESLVATVAHELGHVHLLADKRLTGEEEDHEHLTDLLTVFFGLGVFTANAAFRFSQWESGGYQGWRAGRLGYLSEAMYGYSLAAFAWMREESKPEWSKYLASNINHYFKRSVTYLEKTENTCLPRLGRYPSI